MFLSAPPTRRGLVQFAPNQHQLTQLTPINIIGENQCAEVFRKYFALHFITLRNRLSNTVLLTPSWLLLKSVTIFLERTSDIYHFMFFDRNPIPNLCARCGLSRVT